MLLSEKSETKLLSNRTNLSSYAKQLTTFDFLNGTIEYNKSYWKLN
jgi:hypothetical protein